MGLVDRNYIVNYSFQNDLQYKVGLGSKNPSGHLLFDLKENEGLHWILVFSTTSI
jgi:hypothetical protein